MTINGELRIPQSPSITGTSSSDCLVSYIQEIREWGVLPSAEVQSVYSTDPADWGKKCKKNKCSNNCVGEYENMCEIEK